MLKIFNLNSFLTQNTNNNQQKYQKNPLSDFSFKGSNLAPLKQDTISFGAKKRFSSEEIAKRIGLRTENDNIKMQTRSLDDKRLKSKERTISNGLANVISEEAKSDTKALKGKLTKITKNLMSQKGELCTKDRPIYALEFRTKEGNSIREKASQKKLTSKEQVKRQLTDIIGARIILGDGMLGGGNLVISKLTEAVNEGKLKVIEVENHVPADKKYQYASQTVLRQLAKASSDKYGIECAERITVNASGYPAIHMLVEFPDGYIGEIQILGHDVAIFKDLEDVPHKVLLGKSVDSKYDKIKELLSPMIALDGDLNTPENIKRAKLRSEYSAYTAAAYKHERTKGPVGKKSAAHMIPTFYTIEEFKKTQKRKIHLKPEWDFNNLYRLKTQADWK